MPHKMQLNKQVYVGLRQFKHSNIISTITENPNKYNNLHDFIFLSRAPIITSRQPKKIVAGLSFMPIYRSASFNSYYYYHLRLLDKTRCQTAPGYMNTV